ncbi:MAG: XRE family transcriptional regulator [Acidobacteriota bacterium]
MRSFPVEITPSVMKWARKSLSLEMDEVARKAKVSLDDLQAWELGDSYPTFAQLQRLARFYKRPTAAFFLASPPGEPDLPSDFRGFDPESPPRLSMKTRLEVRRVRRCAAWAGEIRKLLGLDVMPHPVHASLDDDPELLAVRLRAQLRVDQEEIRRLRDAEAALPYWRELAEETGTLVFQISLPKKDGARGLSLREDGQTAILLNGRDAPSARTFTLLHEIAHIALKRDGICNPFQDPPSAAQPRRIEVFCNAVAAAVLMPKVEFLREPEVLDVRHSRDDIVWGEERIRKLARKYKVSSEAAVRRLSTLGLVSSHFYQEKRGEYRRLADTRQTWAPVQTDPGKRVVGRVGRSFTRLVLSAFHAGKVSAADVSDLLGTGMKNL